MRCFNSISLRLALSSTKPQSSRICRSRLLHPITSNRAFSTCRSARIPPIRSFSLSFLLKEQRRYCSYRRMCRYTNADLVDGSVDITKGREVLPTNTIPRHYDLTLEPNFEKFTYEGSVIIEYVESQNSSILSANWSFHAVWTSQKILHPYRLIHSKSISIVLPFPLKAGPFLRIQMSLLIKPRKRPQLNSTRRYLQALKPNSSRHSRGTLTIIWQGSTDHLIPCPMERRSILQGRKWSRQMLEEHSPVSMSPD